MREGHSEMKGTWIQQNREREKRERRGEPGNGKEKRVENHAKRWQGRHTRDMEGNPP